MTIGTGIALFALAFVTAKIIDCFTYLYREYFARLEARAAIQRRENQDLVLVEAKKQADLECLDRQAKLANELRKNS